MKELLAVIPTERGNVDAPWAVAEALKILLPQIADDTYVRTLLEAEIALGRARPEAGFPTVLWSDCLDPEELDFLRDEYGKTKVNAEVRDQAVAALVRSPDAAVEEITGSG